MAITQAFCTSFKKELLDGIHDFRTTGDAFKIALYTSSATLSAATTAYATTNEVPNGSGYTTGGLALTKVNPTSGGTVGYTDFNPDATWGTSTITANGALIYNDTEVGNNACIVLAFGGDKSSSNGNFTVQFPTANSTAAIIRIQ